MSDDDGMGLLCDNVCDVRRQCKIQGIRICFFRVVFATLAFVQDRFLILTGYDRLNVDPASMNCCRKATGLFRITAKFNSTALRKN